MTRPAPAIADAPLASASGPLDADTAARLAPLAEGLRLSAQETIGLGLDLLEDLLDADPEVLRAKVTEVRNVRAAGMG